MRIKTSRPHFSVQYEEIKTLANIKFNFDQDCVRHPGKKQDVVSIYHREICCITLKEMDDKLIGLTLKGLHIMYITLLIYLER